MNKITAILIITGSMLAGCSCPHKTKTSEEISSIVIWSTLNEDFVLPPDVTVKKHQKLLLVESFLKDHPNGWKTDLNGNMSIHGNIEINLVNGDSFCLGYSDNILFRYTQDDYIYKQVSRDEIQRYKHILETIKK